MENKDLFINALNYYDDISYKKKDLFNNVKYYTFVLIENDIEHSLMIFYDKNKKELFKSRFEYISNYIPKVNIWVWSWAMPLILKNQLGLIKKVLNYGLDLGKDYGLLKYILTSSRLKIDSPIQLDINVAIAAYISKSQTVIGLVYDEVKEKIEEIDGVVYHPFVTEITNTSIACSYFSFLDI